MKKKVNGVVFQFSGMVLITFTALQLIYYFRLGAFKVEEKLVLGISMSFFLLLLIFSLKKKRYIFFTLSLFFTLVIVGVRIFENKIDGYFYNIAIKRGDKIFHEIESYRITKGEYPNSIYSGLGKEVSTHYNIWFYKVNFLYARKDTGFVLSFPFFNEDIFCRHEGEIIWNFCD